MRSAVLILLFSLLFSGTASALIVGASPSPKDSADTKARYQPLIDLISKNTEYTALELDNESNWSNFSKKLLASKYDILIAEPHILAHAADFESGLSILVAGKLTGVLSYDIVVKEESKIQNPQDLQQKRICMRPSPNLSNVLVTKLYKNPVTIPVTVAIDKTDPIIIKNMLKGRCEAAVIQHKNLESLSNSNTPLRSIYKTADAPNIGIGISEKFRAEDRAKIMAQLFAIEDLSKINPAFDPMQKIVPAKHDEFKPFFILAGLVWGW